MRLSKRSKTKRRRRRRSMKGGGLWDALKGMNPFAKKEEPKHEAEPMDEGSNEIESHTVASDDLGSLGGDAPASPGAQEGGRRRKRRKSRRHRRKSSKKRRSRRKSRRRRRTRRRSRR